MVQKWINVKLLIASIILLNNVSTFPFFPEPYDKYLNYETASETENGLGETILDDMILTVEQKSELFGNVRSGFIDTKYRWPDKTVIYTLSDDDFAPEDKEAIYSALRRIEAVTCIKFKERDNEEDYVYVTGTTKVSSTSNVGFLNNGRQKLNLRTTEKPAILHEFLHTLGFYHMHSSWDRNKYVKINFRNIKPGHLNGFKSYDKKVVTNFGVEYDFNSIMHYGPYAFSQNKKPTIEPLDPNFQGQIGRESSCRKLSVNNSKPRSYISEPTTQMYAGHASLVVIVLLLSMEHKRLVENEED